MAKQHNTIRQYNPIYELLVPESHDLKGLCAYDVYKQEKIVEIKKYKQANNWKEPTNVFFNSFHNTAKQNVSRYKKEGKEIYDLMQKAMIADYFQNNPGSLAKTVDDNTEESKKNDKKKDFWQKVWSNVVARCIWAVLPIILFMLFFIVAPQWSMKMVKLIRPEVYEEVIKGQSEPQSLSFIDESSKIETSVYA